MPSNEQLIAVVNVIGNLVRSVHLKRALTAVKAEPHLNFWRLIYGHLMDIAVLDWCKLFGSDDEAHQPVHWKNVVPAAEHEKFRADLYAYLGLDEAAWKEFRTETKRYRDQQVAHHDFRNQDIKNYPVLEPALQSAYFYYAYVLRVLRQQGVTHYPDDIADYCARFEKQSGDIAATAMEATKDIKEVVN